MRRPLLCDDSHQHHPLRPSSSSSSLTLRRSGSGRSSERRTHRSKWLIPADHPFKIVWDVLTICLSFLSVYNLHGAIRDRKFGPSPLVVFCDTWFLIDILLNFVTEHKTSDGKVLRDGKSVWARYLTTWFVIDVLSLLPWEMLYVKPVIEMQKRRGFFKKTFFRTRAVVRVTRVLRGRHFKLFGKVARQTKHAGVGARRLLRLLIKYVPKYLLFYRHMKGVWAVRTLRQLHWAHKIRKAFHPVLRDPEDKCIHDEYVNDNATKLDDDTESLHYDDDQEWVCDFLFDDEYYFDAASEHPLDKQDGRLGNGYVLVMHPQHPNDDDDDDYSLGDESDYGHYDHDDGMPF